MPLLMGASMYVLERSVSGFPISELIPLIEQAAAAANQGIGFDEAIATAGTQLPMYVRLIGPQPSALPYIEVGIYHGELLSNETKRELEAIPGVILNVHEPIMVIGLAWSE